MIDPVEFVAHLDDSGIDLYTGVPDSLLKHLCAHLLHGLPRERHVIAANEGAAVGIAIGHYLRTGQAALVYLQNSGFGNTVNPLLSLADSDVYGVPMVVVVGWRGRPGVPDEPQHAKQGRVMTALLDALELPWAILPREQAAAEATMDEALARAHEQSCPSVVLVEADTFGPPPASSGPLPAAAAGAAARPALPSREEALRALVAALGPGTVNVATTGMLSRELFEHRQATGTGGALDFLTVGGMGHASQIALGIAMREDAREVWCLDGDGAVLMHMGSLAVIADHAPPSYFHAVFNNGVHDSVGGQPTSIGRVRLPDAALAAGYRASASVESADEVAKRVAELRAAGGPALLELRVRPGNRPGIGRPTRTPAESKNAFMAAIRR